VNFSSATVLPAVTPSSEILLKEPSPSFKRESKRGEASLIKFPPLLKKERGTGGEFNKQYKVISINQLCAII